MEGTQGAGTGNLRNLSVRLPCRRQFAFVLVLALMLFGSAGAATAAGNSEVPAPLMAYYYIWFDVTSWERNKRDTPLLGSYSSDDRRVMEQHVRWAKAAGIDGFIVSWKSTFLLDRRLEQLIEVAEAEGFDLWIIYQGLDYERNPVPIEQVIVDLQIFRERFAGRKVFATYERPVVIWSGTWKFSVEDIAMVASDVGDDLYLLASERNVPGYARLAELVDGNAYYWSSVNPATYPGYDAKLAALGEAVHAQGGLWIAPAAPGFDARLLGGATAVERLDGATLRRQMAAAQQSQPDAIGLISWNEFSENSHVEPSATWGTQSLEVIAELTQGRAPMLDAFDSSAPGTTRGDVSSLAILAGMVGLVGVSVVAIALRTDRAKQQVRH